MEFVYKDIESANHKLTKYLMLLLVMGDIDGSTFRYYTRLLSLLESALLLEENELNLKDIGINPKKYAM